MLIINTNGLDEFTWASENGAFTGAGKQVSEALGRIPQSTNIMERHPFDIEICRIPAGKTPYPYHSHSMQWEFYHVISGRGSVRSADGTTPIGPGDAFIFKPGEPHQITAGPDGDLALYVVADNPIGESCYFPDTDVYYVRSPQGRYVGSNANPASPESTE